MNKTILITGATSGIGKASAIEFAKHNYNLILTGRRQERLEKLAKDLSTAYGIEVDCLSFDVRSFEECEAAYEKIKDRPIDVLLNNAGKAKGYDPIHEGKIAHWDEMIDTNLKGLLYMTRLVSPSMVKAQFGHIINICSTAGKEEYPNGNVYCATKHAVDSLTRALRIDLHKYNIKVSQIAPGHVEETEFAKVRFDGNEEKAKIYNDFNPLTSRDVAEAIYFAASRPSHVVVQDILMMGTQQANSNMIHRSGRNK